MNQYRPRKGARFTVAQANAIGRVLEKIGFDARPQQLVDAARPADSPIHRFFEWNNAKAAEAHRVQQARLYINHIDVIVLTDEGEKPKKAFHSVIVNRGESSSRGYCSLETIVENEDLTAQVVARALRQANYWSDQYKEFSSYPELRGIFAAIEAATIKARRKKRVRRKARAA